MADIRKVLEERKEKGLLRRLKPASLRQGGRVNFEGREYVDFSSNDYLGLSRHPRLLAAAQSAIEKFGVSAGASRLMSGDLKLHHELEERIAIFKNKEAAIFFNSGYQANTGIISCLYGKGDCVFSDRLNHASIIDGILLSGARMFRFLHNDAGHLDSLLKKERGKFGKALIITESVFSMDGDKAPLKELAALKEKYNCQLFVDEAHATGIFGASGSGLAEEQGVGERIDFLMGTFSKALAGFGAYLAASRETIQYLINACRSFIYSTSLPPAIIYSNLVSLDLVKEEPFRREKVLGNAEYLRGSLKSKGFEIKGESQIIPLITGTNASAIDFAYRLQQKGYWVLPIRPPTVPENEARIRFSLSASHEKETLDDLINDASSIGV